MHPRESLRSATVLLLLVLPLSARAANPGDLDPSFGVGGRVLTQFIGAGAARALAIQPDGKVVVVGDAPDDFAALIRYTAAGGLDPTFGVGGRVLTPFMGAGVARDVVVDPDGKTVVVGDAPGDFAAL